LFREFSWQKSLCPFLLNLELKSVIILVEDQESYEIYKKGTLGQAPHNTFSRYSPILEQALG